MGHKWVIIERDREDYNNDGIRFKAFPVIDGANPERTVEIVVGEGEKHWLVQENPIIVRTIIVMHVVTSVKQLVREHGTVVGNYSKG